MLFCFYQSPRPAQNIETTIIGQEIGDKTTREIGEAINKFDPAVDIQPMYARLDNSDKYIIAFQTDGLETDKPAQAEIPVHMLN